MNDDPDQYSFLDTTILIYGHDQTAGHKYAIANQLLQDHWQSRTGCLSIQVLQEFYVNITQKISVPLPVHEAIRNIALLKSWHIHVPTADDLLGGIQIQQRYQLSFWDALIVRSAAQLDCTILWSEDLSHGQFYEGVEVRNPFI
jgi:predicted nucleic acid-binding protein